MFTVEIIVNGIEAILSYILFRSAIPQQRKEIQQIAGGIVLGAAASFCNFLYLDSTLQIVLIWLLHIGCAFLCFGGTKSEKLLWSSGRMFISLISEKLALRFVIMLQVRDVFAVLRSGTLRYQAMAVYVLVGIFAVVCLCRLKKQKFDLPLQYQAALILFVLCVLSAADLLSDYMLVTYENGSAREVLLSDAVTFLIIVMVFLLLYVVNRLAQIYEERNRLAAEKQHQEGILKVYEESQKMQKIFRAWKHDYRNHCQVVDGLIQCGEYKKAREYLRGLQREMDQSLSFISTGDPVLDIILTSKIESARQKDIKVEINIWWEKIAGMQEQQITTLFGNLLDNAIEANLYVKDTEKRFIQINTKPFLGNMVIKIRNRYDGMIQKNESGFVSRKEEDFHGIGIKQIEKVAGELGGFCRFQAEEDVFTAEIVIPGSCLSE